MKPRLTLVVSNTGVSVLEGEKAGDLLISQSNSATFLPCFVSVAVYIWPDPKHCLLHDPQSSFAPRARRNMPRNVHHWGNSDGNRRENRVVL